MTHSPGGITDACNAEDRMPSRLSDAGTSKLSVLKSLRRLHVSGSEAGESRITDVSVESLVKLTKLEYLEVQNTNITEDGFRRLCNLPRLKQLLILSNWIDPSVVEQLQKDYPAIQFIYSGRPDAK